jgi:hypothetical protein
MAFNVAARACVEEIFRSRDAELMRKSVGLAKNMRDNVEIFPLNLVGNLY